jgi:SAM-dependent methyltransferase
MRLEANSILDGLAESLPFIGGSLLDLGCGRMPYLSVLRERMTLYTGLDLRPDPETAPSVVGNSLFLPFKSAVFDTVLSTQVLEHVRDPFRTIEECSRVLRRGGHLILTVPSLWPLHEQPYDYFRYTKYGLEELARRSGLKVVLLQERGHAASAVGQLTAAVLYDVFGRRLIPRIFAKAITSPVLLLCQVIDAVAPFRSLTLGYTFVARKESPEA